MTCPHDWLKDFHYVNGADGHRVVYLAGLMTEYDNLSGLDVEERTGSNWPTCDPVTFAGSLVELKGTGMTSCNCPSGVLDCVTKIRHYTAGEFNQRVRYWNFAATKQKEAC